MASTVPNQTLKVTLSAKVGNQYLYENTFSVPNIKEVIDRVMTVPAISEVSLILFSTALAAGTYVKNNVKFIAISNKDDTNFVRLRLKKSSINRIVTIGTITPGTIYKNGTYNIVPLTGGTGTGATANITILGSLIFTTGTVTPGATYTNGTYTSVPLTGGTGTGAQATVIVAGAVVTSVTITARGTGYVAGDVLSALNTSLGGTGTGFAVPVATLAGGVTATVLVDKGSGYTNGDNLSALNTSLGGSGTGFAVVISSIETVSDIADYKLDAGGVFVLRNTKINTDKVNGSFVSFNDIDSINAQADTSDVDIEIYVASI